MPLKACPHHVRRLINRLNEQQSGQPNPLKQILKAVRDKEQGKSPDTVPVKTLSEITINLIDFRIRVRTELELALLEIDLPNIVDLIRECPVESCGRLFWAGRNDKVACDDHVELWRRRKNRQKEKEERLNDGKQATEHKHAQLKEEAVKRLSRTAVALLNSIVIHGNRIFWMIDNQAYDELKQIPRFRVPQRYVIRRTLTMLVDRGYLRYLERAERHEDRYEPRQKLIDLW